MRINLRFERVGGGGGTLEFAMKKIFKTHKGATLRLGSGPR